MSELPLFYAPDIESLPELPEEEAAHALRVLRLKEGDGLRLTDGRGNFYEAFIRRAHPKHCELEVGRPIPAGRLWPFRLHIAVAPTKNLDRMEWFCEKATEIGIDEITLLDCRFSERRELKTARLEKILVSAMKQSQKARLPQLHGMTSFASFLNQPFEGQKFIAHCREGEKAELKEALQGGNVLVLIGPEGDFSAEEVAEAGSRGFQPVALGKSRLRTETAALYACFAAHLCS
jgi:16S rRNA (uracil1498-N3)-methyltransferase